MPETEVGIYKKISALVENWFEAHQGESFNLDLICRQLEITQRENRQAVATKLNNEVKKGTLDKDQGPKYNNIYTLVSKSVKNIPWLEYQDNPPLEIKFPRGIEDNSKFGFSDKVVISSGDVIVVAGGSNFGKTTFCLNLLWENFDEFPCTLMGNEYTPGKFARRVKRMTWKEPTNGSGSAKFELIDRRERWWDIVRPDNVNIIDWINLEDNFYQIGMIIDRIQRRLKNGIAVISLQKSPGKELGRGGGFSQDLASLYLTIDFERLTVVKAKEWIGVNPNNKMYGFTIVDGGTKFHNIRDIKRCPKCSGIGKWRGQECEQCLGTGYIDV